MGASRNRSTPRSISRDTAPMAVVVWSVDSTRWARHRRLGRDLGGVAVADFSHHDHVGILAQDGPQPAGKAQVGARVDLHLADAVQRILDRVLDRHDVARPVVEPLEGGVKRGGLARTCGPRHQHHPAGTRQQAREDLGVARAHAQAVQPQPGLVAVQKAQRPPARRTARGWWTPARRPRGGPPAATPGRPGAGAFRRCRGAPSP